jgi:hypothetical protein
MKNIVLAAGLSFILVFSVAQNVGIGTAAPTNKLQVVGTARSDTIAIGTSTPRSPLSFAPVTGQKITLWDDGNAGGNNYGIGVQSGLLQLHSYTSADNIVFGYGKSSAFTERMRIINSGGDGLIVNGRVTLKNGTNPLDPTYGSGVWMYKPDNSSLLGFMGVQNSQNLGFYGGPGGWGFTYDAINSRVGIGNNNPNAPLAFPALLGRKITLFPGGAGNVGIGVHANELRIHSDYEPADITFGYENLAGVFTERFRFKGNGAFAINGVAGSDKQVLMSNSSSSPPAWTTLGNIIQSYTSGNTDFLELIGTTVYNLTNSTLTINVTVPSRIMLFTKTNTWKVCIAGVCETKWALGIYLNGGFIKRYEIDGTRFSALSSPNSLGSDHCYGPDFLDVDPGTHTITFTATNEFNEPAIRFSATAIVIPR